MTHVFVMTNHKGGVGKSTTATNTAFGIVRLLHNADAPNNRVLLIDTDSQGHATLITTGRKNFGRVMSVNFCKNGRRELPLLNARNQEWRPRHESKNSTESEVTASDG